MVASSDSPETAQLDALGGILREATREFAAIEAKLAQLSDRVSAEISGAEHERASI